MFIVALLNDGLQGACHPDAITAHDTGLRFAVFVQELSLHGFAVFGAKLEHVAHFNGGLDLKWFAGDRTGFPSLDGAKIDEMLDPNVSSHTDMLKMIAILVGSGNQILSSLEKTIGINGYLSDADSA
jgi:hypothetical protein